MGNTSDRLLCGNCFTYNELSRRHCRKCGERLHSGEETKTYGSKEGVPCSESGPFSPGETVADRYDIIEEIGRGGMGCVYKVRDRHLNITVALKIIRPERSQDPEIVGFFKDETLLARSITHENVLRIYDIGEYRGLKYISMDYIKGQSLRELLRTSGSLSIATVVRISRQIAASLEASHEKGIIHCDLKPQNIILDRSGHVYTMDFGISTSSAAARPGRRKVFGTPTYMSPEQARGETVDERTDIYNLGLIMYEMATGRAPFPQSASKETPHKKQKGRPPHPTEFNPDIPAKLDRIIMQCLEPTPDKRYPDAASVIAELDEVLIPEKSRGRLYAVLGVLVLVTAGALWLLNPWRAPPVEQPNLIAVMPFENLSGNADYDGLSTVLQNYLFEDLDQSAHIRPLPVTRLNAFLEDLDSHPASDETLKKITLELNADVFVRTRFHFVGGKIHMDIRLDGGENQGIIGRESFEEEYFSDKLTPLVRPVTNWIKNKLALNRDEIESDFNRELGMISSDSYDAIRYYIEGKLFYQKKDWAKSLESLHQALEYDPGFALAMSQLSYVYFYQGNPENGKKYLDQALSHKDRLKYNEELLILGRRENVEGRFKNAIDYLETLLDKFPNYERGYEDLGAIYRNIEEWDLAENCFREVVSLNKSYEEMYLNLSDILQAKGLYASARKHLSDNRKYISTWTFHFETARSFLNEGRYEDAVTELGKCQALDPDGVYIFLWLGMVFHTKGDLHEAESYYRKLPETMKCSALAFLSQLHLMQGKYLTGVKELESGLQTAEKAGLRYDECSFRIALSALFYLRGLYSEAMQMAITAAEDSGEVRNFHDQVFSLLLQGLIHLEMGENEKAEELTHLMESLIKDSGYLKLMRHVHHLEGKKARAEGRFEEARDLLEKAYDLLPSQMYTGNHAFFLEPLALVYEEMGALEEALNCNERILSLTTGKLMWGEIWPRSLFRMGRIHQKMGHRDKAQEFYTRFLHLWEEADPGREERLSAAKCLQEVFTKNTHRNPNKRP